MLTHGIGIYMALNNSNSVMLAALVIIVLIVVVGFSFFINHGELKQKSEITKIEITLPNETNNNSEH